MKTCTVVGCRNKRNKEKGITLHSFPKKECTRNLWMYVLGRHNLIPTNNTYNWFVCSEHFQSRDFDRASQYMVRLKEGAVPSIFSTTSDYSKMLESIKEEDNTNSNVLYITDGLDCMDDLNTREEDNLENDPLNGDLPLDSMQQIKVEDTVVMEISERVLIEDIEDQFFEAEELSCSICEFKTKIKSSLLNHINIHKNLASYSCNDNNRSIINAVREKLRCFKCNICEYTFSKKSELTNHEIKVHGNVRPFQCSQCDHAYKDSVSLTKHVSAIHQKLKPFICPQCDSGFTQKTHLSQHILIVHEKIKKYLCENCDYASGKKNNLTKHILKHHAKDRNGHNSSDERPFKCMHCECTYTDKTGLSRHIIAKHVKLKPFMCSICYFTFSQKSHMNNHILTVHQKIKKYKCSKCKYATGKRNDLKKHNFKYH